MILMILILLLSIAGTSGAQSGQTIRTGVNNREGGTFLYRVEDDQALAEVQILCTREGEFVPSRFILENPRIQIGSFKPAGLWKFIEMESLLSPAALKDKPGLRADRSSGRRLDAPAAAYTLDGRGGVFFRGGEEALQSAFWSVFRPGAYTEINGGLSVVLGDPNPEDQSGGDWFLSSPVQPDLPLYHLAGEIKAERPASTWRLLSALSLSEQSVPGYSVLPGLISYGRFWDNQLRCLYVSPYYQNSRRERPDSPVTVDERFSLKLANGFQGLVNWHMTADSCGEKMALLHALKVKGELLVALAPCQAEYELLPPSPDSETPVYLYNHIYTAGSGWNGNIWRSRGQFSVSHDRDRVLEWEAATEVKRSPAPGRSDSLRVSVQAEPGVLNLTTGLEEFIPLGSCRLKAGGGCVFELWPKTGYDRESLKLVLGMEWTY
ncbi:MAG: hypothetical protein PQJ58_08095 [Spirochaetales bacterium]|nr:hypothetical protein [Spirochaetales bacterium]